MISKRVRDAEEVKKRVILKALFKKVVRAVITNNQWLDGESDDDPKISSNVRKNIALLMRTKRKMGMLTAAEKSLIRTPHLVRTISDRKKLCILFAGLRCFFFIPPKLRARLVPAIKFLSLSTGRTIIRQGDLPLTIYFIVTGEVQMIKTAGSTLSRKLASKGEIIFGPGDCIGDVAMLEDCTRTHTFITTSQCELLVLFDNDFISILKPYMKKIWNEKKTALKALDYFEFLSEDQILKACKLCTLKQYKPLDTIYIHDRGTLTNVHFVLSGECVILQCLEMKVIIKNGRKIHQLVDQLEDTYLNFDSEHVVKSTSDTINKSRNRTFEKLSLSADFACGIGSRASTMIPLAHSNSQMNSPYSEGENKCFVEEEIEAIGESQSSSLGSFKDNLRKFTYESEPMINFESQRSKVSIESEIYTVSSSSSSSTSRTSINTDIYESHFIDVGSLTFGGIFGLGEKMHHRVIMARNTVQCLLLPRFFLLDKKQNPGNIWQRRLFYLDCIIPSREALFDDFLKTLKWKKFKFDFIHRNLISNTIDIARDDDIPILCRIEEDRETY
ncbi:uncharacterized protein LOC135439600 isoform X1 [Drosophila montana]|uniref:uncharacterized protein LOC135439600 isoform X1 n=1 Tax=Drosophila montana TaxID=40370 RepID=UPI00313CFAB8